MTNKDKGLIKLIILLTLVVFIPFCYVIWYSQPIDETLTCYKDYKCKVETTRFFNIKTVKEFNITPNSKITTKYIYKSSGPKSISALSPLGHLYFVEIDETKPLEYPVCQVFKYNKNYYSVCKPILDNVVLNFEKYQNKIIDAFSIPSTANILNFLVWSAFALFLWSLLVFVLIINDSDFYKEYKRKRKQESNKQQKNNRERTRKEIPKAKNQKRFL